MRAKELLAKLVAFDSTSHRSNTEIVDFLAGHVRSLGFEIKVDAINDDAGIEKVNLIREAAGDRFADIELNWAITAIVITDDREKTAEMALSAIDRGLHPDLEVDVKLFWLSPVSYVPLQFASSNTRTTALAR